MNCTECKRELEYMEEYLKSPNGDIICGGCRDTYALEHSTAEELADYVFSCMFPPTVRCDVEVNADYVGRAGDKAFLALIKAAGDIPDFIDCHYSRGYAKRVNDEPDEALIKAWWREIVERRREYERAAI